MRIRALYYSILGILAPSVALAHPGHGADGGSRTFLHYLLEPAHGVGLAVFVLVALLFVMRTARRAKPATARDDHATQR